MNLPISLCAHIPIQSANTHSLPPNTIKTGFGKGSTTLYKSKYAHDIT